MKIAIKGHALRGKEVIQILESLGGINTEGLAGTYETFYFIDDKNEIGDNHKKNFPPTYKFYTLEEFEREFPFKIGDRVISATTNLTGIITKLSENGWYYVKYDNGNFACAFGQNLKLYKEMERNVTLTLDKAKEWYNKGGELKEIALQAFTEKELTKVELPKSWEEYCKQGNPIASWRYTIPTKYEALFKLEHLRDCWRQGWESIWDISPKWCIRLWGNELNIGITTNISHFLTFPTKEMAEEFLKCFRDLIEQAGDLI